MADLQQAIRQIFSAALDSADARAAVARHVSVTNRHMRLVDSEFDREKPFFVVALGKAALAMSQGIEDALSDSIAGGVITCPRSDSIGLNTSVWQIFFGGHPFPNADSLAAADAAFALIERANSVAGVVIFLVSGGGSSMFESPISAQTTLDDLREANQQLVLCGATINEINAVRRAFSSVKGGRLAKRLTNGQGITLIVSDTNADDESSVASGPTLSPPVNAPSALEVVKKYGLENTLPASILRDIYREGTSSTQAPQRIPHFVVLDNQTALRAAANCAEELGFVTVIEKQICEQQIDDGCRLMIAELDDLQGKEKPVCVISGGEFRCPVHGNGIGGRNLETVLRCAMELEGANAPTVVLSAGTDGIDGNSDAAGAIADETTISRARELALEPNQFLLKSDSYHFFDKLGGLLITGPTGTNVRDVRVVLRQTGEL